VLHKEVVMLSSFLRSLFASSVVGLAAASLASLALPAAAEEAFLNRFSLVELVASTVPANGDLNPYGIAVVMRSVGALKRGHVLVSNFNNGQNLQGTGTTIVQIAPDGTVTQFARLDSPAVAALCPGGVGLTTALAVLDAGWVIVGSLPSSTGQSADAGAGCLIVLDSEGGVAETFTGGGIDGPWDMVAVDDGDQAQLFVTNVLNGDVTTGSPHTVNAGTVLRITLAVPEAHDGIPRRVSTTVIGSGFAETADPAALVIGPTGVALGWDGTLYVADSLNNRIAAIADALTRTTSAATGTTVSQGGALNDPLGLAVAPDGHLIVTNGNDGNLVEVTPGGAQVAVKTVETATGAGSLFGLAIAPHGRGVYFVDDGDNTVKRFGASQRH
jgi:hypothetical protein